MGAAASNITRSTRVGVAFLETKPPRSDGLKNPLSSRPLFLLIKAESISTLNFAARCMRVVARQRVNEVVSDSLLLERARRQISALRRRLVEAEAAAAIASSPAPSSCPPVPSQKAEAPPASAQTPPAPPPLLPAAETKTAAVSVTPETSNASCGGSGNIGPGAAVGPDETAARSGGGRLREEHASLVSVPREARREKQEGGDKPVGNGGGTMMSEGAGTSTAVEASSRKSGADATNPRPELLTASQGETNAPPRQSLRAEEGTLNRDVNGGHPKPLPLSSSSLPSSSSCPGEREGRRDGGVKIRTLLNARRGRDIVVRGKIATAVAAANAAAAAATAVASAIAATGGGRGRHAFAASKHATTTSGGGGGGGGAAGAGAGAGAAAVRHGSATGAAVRSQLRQPGEALRATRARKAAAFRSSSSRSASGRPALPLARGANSPAAASATRVAAAAGRSADETSVATQALIERFSSREEELLRELEAWKDRCKSLEEREAPARSGGSGRALARRGGGGTRGERLVGGKPPRLEVAALTATRAAPSETAPAPAKPQRPLQTTSKASPATDACEEERTGASQASPDARRSARRGVATAVSPPKQFGPEQGRKVDPPKRASTSIEVSTHLVHQRLGEIRGSCRRGGMGFP